MSLHSLSFDITHLILEYLSPAEIRNLKKVCQSLNVAVESPQCDVLYLPYLYKLKVLDPSISVIPPPITDNNYNHWVKNRVAQSINDIWNKQNNEIAHFQNSVPLSANLKEKLNSLNNNPTTLATLIYRDSTLNEINAELIRKKINIGSRSLNISHMGLTRFPASVFDETVMSQGFCDKSFWENLEDLDCSNNNLTVLPSLNKLKSLAILNCHHNQLTVLPSFNHCKNLIHINGSNNALIALSSFDSCQHLRAVNFAHNQLTDLSSLEKCDLWDLNLSDNQLTGLPSLNKCKSLNAIDCSRNRLTVLPSFDHLTSLMTFYCSDNLLTILPSFDNCPELFSLDCAGNQLTQLPPLDQCPELERVDCSQNQLDSNSIPVELRAKLGDTWYNEMLATQKSNLSLPSANPSYLPFQRCQTNLAYWFARDDDENPSSTKKRKTGNR